ncbi:MAG TPA: tripartite tricarboxylate transporter substrate binding protein [Burkholderiales bacterium]|nr:tripartite tricarboxylate transporter substrate binding protein [Burkholderiales bacterium]
MKKFSGISIAAFALIMPILGLSAGGALAQAYPSKTVRVVIPWPPGGSNDVVGRLVMQKLTESLGQQFIIDNRPGAAGSIGADVVAKAPPDGYTIMVHSTTHVGNASMYKNLPYDVIKDFAAVGLLSAQPGVLTVHPSLPVKSVKEFIALAKARPNQLLYSSSGNGSAPHLQMALFISMTGIKLVHVPYKGGAPQVTALVSGETQASFATIATVVNHIRAGKLRPLGVGSLKPSKALPGVPTIAASGVPGYEMSPWIGVFAPAGTPKAIINRLNAEINKALTQPDIVQKLENQALDPWPSTPDEFSARMKADLEKYAKLIKLTGAKVE